MKQSVHKMEQKVRQLASQFEKVNNLLLWSDPTLSITALFFLLAVTLTASMVLFVVPFNLACFFGGLVVFIPQEAMGRLKKIKRISKLLLQRVKAEYRVRHDTKLPAGAFLPRLQQTRLQNTMTGHLLSGDLCSQTWSGSVSTPPPTSTTTATSTAATAASTPSTQANTAKWTRKWCELWSVPGVLAIEDEMAYGVEKKPPVLYDMTYVKAEYM